MLEALNLKNNAETRYRCQVSVYRTIGPLALFFEIKLFCFVVGLRDIEHDVEAKFYIPELLTASGSISKYD